MTTGVWIRTKENNEVNRQSQLKRYQDPLEREKLRQAQNRPEVREKKSKSNLGKKRSLETREKMRQAQIKRYRDPTEREKSRKSQKIAQNRPEVKEKQSKSQVEHYKNNPDRKEKHRKFMLTFKHTLKTRKKQRKSAIKRVEDHYGISRPNFNLKACEYFKSFDEQHNTKGSYALHGNGEHHIKELGYFPDYINFDLKLIIEWDEEKHYENNILSEKDLQRQKEIQELFPDFEFRRIREKEYRSTL